MPADVPRTADPGTAPLAGATPVRRVFLGWDRPLCETVPGHLLADAAPGLTDLRGVVVVTPTRQSSWRLRGALPRAAAARGIGLIGLEIVTPPVLLAPPPRRDLASPFDLLLAWRAALAAVRPDELRALLGARRDRAPGAGGGLAVARRIEALREELADGGFAIADVAGSGAATEEAERWADLAEFERRGLAQLAAWGLRDPIAERIANARAGVLPPGLRRVVLAGVPDPPELLRRLLERWAARGGAVEILVGAPADEADAFDAWGRPLPEAWQDRVLPLSADDLSLAASPEDQAIRIARAVGERWSAAAGPAGARLQLAIGVPDREVVPPLLRELEGIGLTAFDPRNRPAAETPLYRLVDALLALRRRDGYDETAALLRHPDVLAEFGGGAALLRELDEVQSNHLPVTLGDLLESLGRPTADGPPRAARSRLAPALRRLQAWRAELAGGDLADGLRRVLGEIYRARTLADGDPAAAAFQQAATALDEVLRECGAAAARAGDDAVETLRARLQDVQLKPERGGEAVDLEGWLELAWNPAPVLFVAGMNEGLVPDSRVGDLFLPDALRRAMDLRDDRRRAARDAYVLAALLEQRRAGGRVLLAAGKTTAAGDPLRPSRLLFRCPDAELVARARQLFATPPSAQDAAPYETSFRLDPGLVPPGAVDDRRTRRMSPTTFRDYLACPLRFYLRHALAMEPADDAAREPDARAFGHLAHHALERMARAPERPWACGDARALADWLEACVRDRAREVYGVRPWLGVHLAVDSAARRLRAFAERQVAWHAAGWDLFEPPEEAKSLALDGCEIRGRIDRMDRHRDDGTVCILDYKTSDRLTPPPDQHLGPPDPEDDFPEAVVPAGAFAEGGGRRGDRRWADLQLPLYREMLRAELGPGTPVRIGYVGLAAAAGETQFALWDGYTEALHESAVRCARAVIRRIRGGVFWPPRAPRIGFEELDGLLLGDPGATILPPAAPWRAAP